MNELSKAELMGELPKAELMTELPKVELMPGLPKASIVCSGHRLQVSKTEDWNLALQTLGLQPSSFSRLFL